MDKVMIVKLTKLFKVANKMDFGKVVVLSVALSCTTIFVTLIPFIAEIILALK